MQKTPNLGIFLKFVGGSFIIDKLALLPREPRSFSSGVETGFCVFPNGEISSYRRDPNYFYCCERITLPPGFDLHRFITHINRGITHFHGSFWPLPRRLSDAAFEEAEASEQWLRYMRLNGSGFQYLGITHIFGVEKRDGKRIPLFKYDTDVRDTWWDCRLKALAKVNATEFKKFLDDPSRKIRTIPRPRPNLKEAEEIELEIYDAGGFKFTNYYKFKDPYKSNTP
ncbi:hypothetical protein B0H14DRAFT_3531047 [Mycena olivaceomarginata]|nr:hypothetical protein B0H14DRAFT_3531047 [Mycena olivaceomarginata]